VAAGGAVAVLALASAALVAGPAEAGVGCHRVRALVFSDTYWTVRAIDTLVCSDPDDGEVLHDVRITRNGVVVASGRGGAVYYCQGNDLRTYTGAGKTIRVGCS
jgi:hypothetical protein